MADAVAVAHRARRLVRPMALLAEATAAALAPMELEAQLRARVVDELELAAHRVLLPQNPVQQMFNESIKLLEVDPC